MYKEVRKMSKDPTGIIIDEDDSDSWQAQRQLEEQREQEDIRILYAEADSPRHGSPEDRGSADRYY